MALILSGLNTGQEMAPAAGQSIHFKTVEIWLDSKTQPLAAYQIEFKPNEESRANVKIVGIEGGAHAAFAHPPYYDLAAMQQERVIIAAFSTSKAEALPHGRTRIATIHVQITGDGEPQFETNAMALATVEGREITAGIEVVQPK